MSDYEKDFEEKGFMPDSDDYDEDGNKIYVPEWWMAEGDGTARGYKDWESSNDRG